MRNQLLAKEQPRQEQAIEYYCSLGERRNYARVAAEFSVSLSSVKLWARSFRWRQRVKDRDIQIARAVASRTIGDEVNHRERNLKIVQMSLVRLAKAIVDGGVKMTLGDLDKLIRLEAFLSNEPDSRQEVVFAELKGKSDEELREMVREEMRMLGEVEQEAELRDRHA